MRRELESEVNVRRKLEIRVILRRELTRGLKWDGEDSWDGRDDPDGRYGRDDRCDQNSRDSMYINYRSYREDRVVVGWSE